VIFSNPLGLLGLLSLPIILILHLLRERRKRYTVSNLGLWAFLDVQVRGPRLRRIPFSWLLVMDLLVAALLSFALAQPRLELPFTPRSTRHLFVLVDVSTSMKAQDIGLGLTGGNRFSQAVADAGKLLQDMGPKDVATVIAYGNGARVVGDTRQQSRDEIMTRLAALQAGDTGHSLVEALALGQASYDGKLPAEFHVFSDGAYPQENLVAFPSSVAWHRYGSSANNQAVLQVSSTAVGENELYVFVRLANFDTLPVLRVVSLFLDGTSVANAEVTIPANSVIPYYWRVRGRPSTLNVSLLGGDILPEDDTAYQGMQAGGRVRVALVADEPNPIQQAVRALPQADLKLISPADYSRQANNTSYDLSIFRNYLPDTLPDGVVLLVEPPMGGAGGAFPPALGRADVPTGAPVRAVANDPLLNGVDLTGVRWNSSWRLQSLPSGMDSIVQVGGEPILLRGVVNGGRTSLVVLLADLASGNLTEHPAFPILIANLVTGLHQAPLPIHVQAGEPIRLPARGEFYSMDVTSPAGGSPVDFDTNWPQNWTDTATPGFYQFSMIENDGSATDYFVGVNAGDLEESDLQPQEWLASLAQPGATVSGSPALTPGEEEARRLELTPWLLGLAILGFFLEAYLAWR